MLKCVIASEMSCTTQMRTNRLQCRLLLLLRTNNTDTAVTPKVTANGGLATHTSTAGLREVVVTRVHAGLSVETNGWQVMGKGVVWCGHMRVRKGFDRWGFMR